MQDGNSSITMPPGCCTDYRMFGSCGPWRFLTTAMVRWIALSTSNGRSSTTVSPGKLTSTGVCMSFPGKPLYATAGKHNTFVRAGYFSKRWIWASRLLWFRKTGEVAGEAIDQGNGDTVAALAASHRIERHLVELPVTDFRRVEVMQDHSVGFGVFAQR